MPHGAPMTIGTALWCKGRLHLVHLRPQMQQHRFEHRVDSDQQMVLSNRTGRVPITDMPGIARDLRAGDAQQRLDIGDNFDDPPILEHKPRARVHRNRLRQIHIKRQAGLARELFAPDQPLRIAQRHLVRRCGPGLRRDLKSFYLGHLKSSRLNWDFLNRFAPK